jgi:creatinine amidohydrolase
MEEGVSRTRKRVETQMQLQLSSWPEIEAYLAKSKAILIPIGSTEQHGPTGLIGTDALCPEFIARRVGEEAGILIGPTFNVGQSQHHMGFPGSMTLRASTMIAAITDWAASLHRHGFERLYWLNGHGGNVATINAAFTEIYRDAGFAGTRCLLRNWWELAGIGEMIRTLFPTGEGSHATPSEISLTWFAHPEAIKHAAMTPKVAPTGPIYDAADYRRRFPDGRIGSDPTLASREAGEKLAAAATRAVLAEFKQFEAG